MKSLLNKSLSQFLICAIVVLLLSAPLFYLLTKYYYAEEIQDILEAVNSGVPIPTLYLEENILAGMIIHFILVFAILSISLLITMRFITHRLWQPFEKTLNKIETFNLEQSELPTFEPNDIKEFTRLNNSVSKLMEKDKQYYLSQKEFTENASHELQTPIAIVQSKLDLLLQENLNEQQSAIVAELYDVNTRMSRLNKNLLLLSKIENDQYQTTERINIVRFVEDVMPLYHNLYDHQNIRLRVVDKQAEVTANKYLFESLLNNLVVNAIRHSKLGGQIDICVSSHALSVTNTADGQSLDEHLLFRRFQFTSDAKRGNGLGLSIVKAVCDYHKWTINYSFQNKEHCFTVTFNNK